MLKKKIQKKIAVLVNHASRRGKQLSEELKLKDWLEKYANDYKIFATEKLSDGEKLYQACQSENFDWLLVLGGDGTLSEVVHRLLSSELSQKPKIAVIAAGTGCDFERHLKKEFGDYSGLDWLLTAKSKKIDAGFLEYKSLEAKEMQSRYFINIAHAGFGGDVTRYANTRFRKLGTFSWPIATLWTSNTYRPIRSLICIDGDRDVGNLFMLVVGNGSSFGAGMHILPDSQVSDGKLDILYQKDTSRLSLLRWLPQDFIGIYKKKKMSNPYTKYSQAKSIDLMSLEKKNFCVDIDGDTYFASELHFKIIAKALEVLVPKN